MAEKNNDNIFRELFDSIKYLFESKKGKLSLDSYLDIVGEYSDRIIIQCKKEGYIYKGGNCKVSEVENNSSQFRFEIKMFFENKNAECIEKSAERYVDVNRFTTDTIVEIRKNKIIILEIDEP